MHLHGVPMDENDDKGRPPYPIVDQLSNDEVYDSDDDETTRFCQCILSIFFKKHKNSKL